MDKWTSGSYLQNSQQAEVGIKGIRLCIEEKKMKIRFGVLKGKVKVSEDFDAPLPDDLLSEFE